MPVKSVVYEMGLRHVQASKGNGYILKEKYQAFYPSSHVVCEEKPVECHNYHIS